MARQAVLTHRLSQLTLAAYAARNKQSPTAAQRSPSTVCLVRRVQSSGNDALVRVQMRMRKWPVKKGATEKLVIALVRIAALIHVTGAALDAAEADSRIELGAEPAPATA